MKASFERLRTPPRISSFDWILTLLPALVWVAAVYGRGWGMKPYCSETPQLCSPQLLLPIDQPALGLEATGADALSFATQGLSGVVALGIPLIWFLFHFKKKDALRSLLVDIVIALQITVLNGLCTEVAHWLSVRPRPFVYANPIQAQLFSNYTSFYSGHTSFAASATLGAALMLLGRQASKYWISAALALCYSLTSLTGLYRVLAGRHFPSDVTVGAIAGFVVATLVALKHRAPQTLA